MMRTQHARPPQCIFIHIASCFYNSSILCTFTFHHFFMPTLLSSPSVRLWSHQGLYVVTILFRLFLHWDMCCCTLLLRRIAEFSCLLLNSLTTLNHFILSLTSHLHTTNTCAPTHSHCPRPFPLCWVTVSLSTQQVHACIQLPRTTGVIHRSTCFSMSGHLHNSHQSTATLSHPTVSSTLQSHSLL